VPVSAGNSGALVLRRRQVLGCDRRKVTSRSAQGAAVSRPPFTVLFGSRAAAAILLTQIKVGRDKLVPPLVRRTGDRRSLVLVLLHAQRVLDNGYGVAGVSEGAFFSRN